ncbi:O-acetyl-ADP-ribose deacetylase [Empedobacter brevis]|uniref:O-acetyl-ADP-ribose deacetylase n=1 Tax=Empedobacter brevis TaxID=247 RepID=UPI00289895C7|nr:O-acetyl-ADP-ribose deacetylase [Empedobacter brevis]
MSKITIKKGDITKLEADVIVNAANTSLLGGGGVDGAIHRAGGSEILEDCRKIIARQGGCKVGEAVITTAGKLNARYVIHTVGPVWNGGTKNEKELLRIRNCYLNALSLAAETNCKTIAFPSISTGIYKFPKEKATQVALQAIRHFLQSESPIEEIILVSFDEENFNILKNELQTIEN